MSTLKTDKLYSTDRSTGSDENILLNDDGTTNLKGNTTVTGTCTATTFSGSGASLTNVPDSALSTVTASKLTGALPAISGAALTGITSTPPARRNLIQNGSMQLQQRLPEDGTMQTGTSGYTVDRWQMYENTGGVVTWGRSADAPDGFEFCHHVDVAISGGMGSGTNNGTVTTHIEDRDLIHLKFGTADAVNLTLSFWVKSKQTGTYAIWMRSEQNTSRAITKTYTISAADTWEKKTINYAGDTSGGGIRDASSSDMVGLQISWCMATDTGNQGGTGSTSWHDTATNKKFEGHNVNVMSDAANYFKLTGVQLEVGDTATDFEHVPYGEELARCQRYCKVVTTFQGVASNTSTMQGALDLQPEMRVAPTLSLYPAGKAAITRPSTADYELSSGAGIGWNNESSNGGRVYVNGWGSSLTADESYTFIPEKTHAAKIICSAEF